MSARQAGGGVAIAVGIIAGIAAIPTAGASLWAWTAWVVTTAAVIGAGIATIVLRPKGMNADGSRAQDLQIGTISEGSPIPVIFGEQRVVGNFMNYEIANFRSKRVTGRSDGSKGAEDGPASLIGFDYFLYFEYGLCRGPVDECVQVFSTPGETKMRGEDPTAIVFDPADTYHEFLMDSQNPTELSGSESGLVRLYKGGLDQDRAIASDPYHYSETLTTGAIKVGYYYEIVAQSAVNFMSYGAASNTVGVQFKATSSSGNILTTSDSLKEFTGLNYRGICWALFIDFLIGRFPTPKSYHFLIRRFPAHDTSYEMKRPDGTSITGFKVRGSASSLKRAYYEANPAAIIYEILTDKVWGRGISQDDFDEATWIAVSEWCEDRHIGMSMTLDSPEKVMQIVDVICKHLKLVITRDDGKLKLRCLLDLATTHAHVNTISKADIIGDIQVNRPLWHSTYNEIRLEFINNRRNYRPDAVRVDDIGNWQLTGRKNPIRITLNGFSDFNTARRQAFRMLREMSYPLETLQFKVNRFHSQIEVGDVFRLLWDEFDGAATVWCLVTKIEDSDSEDDIIVVTAVEDPTLAPTAGTVATGTIPTQHPWERIPDVDEDDVALWNGETPAADGGPIKVFETPAILRNFVANASGNFFVLVQRPAPFYNAHAWQFKERDQNNYAALSISRPTSNTWAIAGELVDPYLECNYTDRSTVGFTFRLHDPGNDEADVLSEFSAVDTYAQDLETIIKRTGKYLIVGEEMMQIGMVEKVSDNLYRARNIVRGRHGTPILPLPDGEQIFFCIDFPPSVDALRNDLQRRTKYDFTARASGGSTVIDLNSGNEVSFDYGLDAQDWDGTFWDDRYTRLCDSQLPAEFFDAVDAGATYTVRFRVRRYQGWGDSWYDRLPILTQNLNDVVIQYALKDVANGIVRLVNPGTTIPVAGGTWPVPVLDPGEQMDPVSGLVSLSVPKTFRQSDLPGNSSLGNTEFLIIIVSNLAGRYGPRLLTIDLRDV